MEELGNFSHHDPGSDSSGLSNIKPDFDSERVYALVADEVILYDPESLTSGSDLSGSNCSGFYMSDIEVDFDLDSKYVLITDSEVEDDAESSYPGTDNG